jgi:phenylpropionate dioxygenase-like ring-hydroxylating dioxygenase large terminal subunit
MLTRDINEGEYKTFELFGEHVIAKREKGKLVVAKNSCKHRHFKVAEGCGKGPIKCQYHGQRFNYEKQYIHHEFGEFVFLPQFLGKSELLTKLDDIGEEFGSSEMEVKAPFHLWIQNTADPNHLGTIHKTSFSKLFDNSRPENVYLSEFESSYSMRLKDEVSDKYKKYVTNEAMADMGWFHYLGFPNLSVTSFMGIFYSVEYANPAPIGCVVNTRFFVAKNSKVPKLLKSMALEANIKILLEDKELVEKWAHGYQYDGSEQWMNGEDRIKRYCDELKARGFV